MTRSLCARRGVRLGLLVGAGWFTADLLGAFAAIGGLFDPRPEGWLLLGIALLCALLAAGALGGLAGALWPERWHVPPRLVRPLLILLFIGVAVGGFALRAGRNLPPAATARPEVSAARPAPVLWVMLDTLRADTFYGPSLGFDNAPRVGELAKGAQLFTDAESVAGWTIPSVASLMTGLHENTMDSSAGSLPDWTHTVAEHLRAAGYATRAVVDNVIVEPRAGFGAGFETFHQRSAYRFVFSLPSFRLLPVPAREWLRGTLRVSDEGSAGLTDAAIAAMEETGGAPLFLYVHYMDPHAPYYPRPELGPESGDLEPIHFFGTRDALVDDPEAKPTPRQLQTLRYRYEREVQAMDRDLGRLLDAWGERFGAESLVVITADHGEEFMDHGRLGHGVTVQREMVHVPLIVRLPASALPADKQARRIDHPVTHLDVLPTTLDVLGVEPLAGGPALQGVSWMPWLRGEAAAPDKPLIGSHGRNGRRVYRYREGPWVVVRSMFYDERPPELALYDLASDPTERQNLFGARADLAEPMHQRLDKLARLLIAARRPGAESAKANEESLRALGYVQ